MKQAVIFDCDSPVFQRTQATCYQMEQIRYHSLVCFFSIPLLSPILFLFGERQPPLDPLRTSKVSGCPALRSFILPHTTAEALKITRLNRDVNAAGLITLWSKPPTPSLQASPFSSSWTGPLCWPGLTWTSEQSVCAFPFLLGMFLRSQHWLGGECFV